MKLELVFWTVGAPKQLGTFTGRRPVLVATGRKWLRVICMNEKLNVQQVLPAEREFMVPVLWKQDRETVTRYGKTKVILTGGEPYPVGRAIMTFRSYGKTHGATQEALDLLDRAEEQYKCTE